MGKFKEEEKKLFAKDLDYIKWNTKFDVAQIKEKYKLVMDYDKRDTNFLYLLECRGLVNIKDVMNTYYTLTERGQKFWHYINSLHS